MSQQIAPSRYISPLRYPGGKARMAPALGDILDRQCSELGIEIWVEPFAGGAGAGLALLAQELVEEVWLVEKNPALAALWRAILEQGPELARRVENTVADMSLWESSKQVVQDSRDGAELDDLELGFAALVINRCSRSGIVAPNVGPIGGKHQTGRWNVSSRFNAAGIADRIGYVHSLAPRIRFSQGDAMERIESFADSGIESEVFLFVDPPYIREGNRLYANGMSELDHSSLAQALNESPCHWLLTYDDEPVVSETLYPQRRILQYDISNTANKQRIAREYAVLSDNVQVGKVPALLPTGQSSWVRN